MILGEAIGSWLKRLWRGGVRVWERAMSRGGNFNSYHDDPHGASGRFDFGLANPPFNVKAADNMRFA
jgi:type I restriction-modification system DNA methylase subunit